MKKILIACLILLGFLGLVVFAESREFGPYRTLQAFLQRANTWTATQTFTTIAFSDGTSQTTAGGGLSSGTATEITADTVITANGIYFSHQTSAVHVQIPTPVNGAQYRFCRTNTGGVSVFTNSGSIGKSGTTAYSHSATDTDACVDITAISGTSYMMTAEAGNWSVKK